MMKINTYTFIGCDTAYDSAQIILFGAPYDSTVSFRPGARFAPNAIRENSYGLELYSPIQQLELLHGVCDIGDLEFAFSNSSKMVDDIESVSDKIIQDGKIPFMIGGEHLVTLGLFNAVYKQYPDVQIIHFDAHADLRHNYLNEQLSHACVLRRCFELVGSDRIHQFGIRSMSKCEADFAKEHVNQYPLLMEDMETLVHKLGSTPIYLTIDLDVLDPSVFPGTGTPEPGGASYSELMQLVYLMKSLNIVGLDVCELSPHYDHSGVSSVTAAKVIREIMIMLQNRI